MKSFNRQQFSNAYGLNKKEKYNRARENRECIKMQDEKQNTTLL